MISLGLSGTGSSEGLAGCHLDPEAVPADALGVVNLATLHVAVGVYHMKAPGVFALRGGRCVHSREDVFFSLFFSMCFP